MKKARSILLSIFVLVMLLCVTPQFLTVNAATKKSVSTSVTKTASKAKGFQVTWKKKSGVKGYQIQYSTSSRFTKSTTKTKTVKSASTTSATISKLKGCNVTYYVRVRTYKTVNGKTVYSSWSSVKKISTLKHSYTAATCTKAKTCKYCEKTTGDELGHKWTAATCTKAKTCTRCEKTSGKALGHKYSAATCTKAKTCTRCKKTSGKALGHNYTPATCTTLKTCTRCAKATGSVLGHNYSAATCTKPATCSRCKKTSGKALGHDYAAATCTAPQTCSKCDATKGSALAHSYVEGVCSSCSQPQENYHPLDSGAWSALIGSSYSITLDLKGQDLDLWYGVNIDQFEPSFREELIADYQNGIKDVKLINGEYYYFGGGDGGSITYTVNGNIISVNCEDYIWLTLERIAGDQLKIVAQKGVSSSIVGSILSWNKCTANEYSTANHRYENGVCACGARKLGIGKWHKYSLSGSNLYVTELDADGIMCYNYLDIATGDPEIVQQSLPGRTLTYQGRTYVLWTGAGDSLDYTNISDNSITADLYLGPDTELQKCTWKRISDTQIVVTEVTTEFWGLQVDDVFVYVE